ncbi:MAG: nitrogen fixation protein NifZ [Campylobacteraceae bacterium]|nr:nitrogen fixation protein NifZ [Campylobacteraceae bacterium]
MPADEYFYEDESRPKFFVGQKVKLLKDIKNDGTYPYLKIGELMMRAGAVGYVRKIGEFLQVIRVYEVHFMDLNAIVEVVGCKDNELEALEPYKDIEAEDAKWLENYYKNKNLKSGEKHG